MKTPLTCLLFLISTISFSQSFDKWKHFIKSESEIDNATYYYTSLDNAYQNKYKIVKKLDTTYCIIENINLTEKHFLKGVTPTNNLWKLPFLFSNHKENKTYAVTTKNAISLASQLGAKGFSIVKIINDKLIIINSDSQTILNDIISLNDVSAVTQESLIPSVEAKINDQNFSINNINKANSNFPDLNGENQVVSVKDDYFDTNDIDLLNKTIPSSTQSSLVSNHASAMATIVSGLGNSSILGKGVARKAKIHSSDFMKIYPDEVTTLQGAITQNHSYGTVIENFYGTLAAAYDTQLFDNPFLTHCFSSGNKGIEGYRSITGNFKQSKNSIAVGAIDQNETIMPFSSKGPAYDGRIKPELVAYSTEGTSNATAITTGVITLMKEHFRNTNSVSLSNALTKAILINSAKDLGNLGPDYTYGYGSIDANKSLKTITENRFINGNLTASQTNVHPIVIPANVKNLKITLVWNDVPATVNSNISLVNDLDLEVISPQNTTFLPWVLNPNTPQQPSTKGKDRLNTIEQVVVNNPIAGTYTIAVLGTFISSNSQEYSIAYEYELQNQFEWNYPITNDNFPYDGKTVSPFKWDTSFEGAMGQLSISYDNGQNWEILAGSINLENEQYTYTPNEQKFSKARLKMTVNNVDYLSDIFTISYDLDISTSLVCDGTTEINWNKPSGVTSFNIYELVGESFQFKAQTTNSTYTYTDAKTYTVTPIIENGEGIKSESTLKYASNSNCYFELTLAEVFEDNKVKISASLFSLFNIKSIELIKIINNSESVISTINNLDSKTFYFLDNNPVKGSNKYRINIILQNGTIVNSEIFNTNYLGNSLFLVYPTQLSKNQELNIESKNEGEALFYLYNLSGQNVITTPLVSKMSSINLDNNASGIYIYKILGGSGAVETGKIIVF